MRTNRFLFLAASVSLAIAFTFSCSGEGGSVIDNIGYGMGSNIWDGNVNTDWYDSLQTEFVITTAQQLAGLAKLVNDGNYFIGKTVKLGTDIHLNNIAWTPIGGEIEPDELYGFGGTFDGNGYVIRGLSVSRDSSDYKALFGIIFPSAVIKNLGVTDSYVRGAEFVGGLVGHNNGEITNSYFIGTVRGQVRHIGGLVGQNYPGTIINSYSAGLVFGGDTGMVGGLVGTNAGIIKDSYSTSIVTMESDESGRFGIVVGGFVGANYREISNCYSTGAVNGESDVGGFVGWNEGEINNSYSTGNVSGSIAVGGFVNGNLGEISNCYSTSNISGNSVIGGFVSVNYNGISNSYSTGIVQGDSIVGGFVGWNGVSSIINNNYSMSRVSGKMIVGGFAGFNSGEIGNSYFAGTALRLTVLPGDTVIVGGFAGGSREGSIFSNSFYDMEKSSQSESYGGEGKTTAEMKTQTTYAGWDFNAIWGLSSDINNGYPHLVDNLPR
jgi:hypothetical protein